MDTLPGYQLRADGQPFAETQGTQTRDSECGAVAKLETLWFGCADLSTLRPATSIRATDVEAVRFVPRRAL
jgi:hypothetical protein